MRVPTPALLGALIGVLATSLAAQIPADVEIRADYAKVVQARNGMSGDFTDEVRQQRMDAYYGACQDLIRKWEPRASTLTTGRLELGRGYVEVADPKRAEPQLEGFVKDHADHADIEDALLLLGDVYRSTDQLGRATSLFEAFIRERAESEKLPFARLGLATSRFFSLDFDRAVAEYRGIMRDHADHPTAADAAFQLVDALIYAGDYAGAVKHVDELLAKSAEAVELERKRAVLQVLGGPAPELEGLQRWAGAPGDSIRGSSGRVVVLCFFMTKSVPSARALQSLSRLGQDFRGRGVDVWGISKAYKAGRGGWDIEREADWLQRYRENPRFVLERELQVESVPDAESETLWRELESPISCSLALARGFENHRAYAVRGVPTVVIIDQEGKVRLIEEGGGPDGGFQTRLFRRLVNSLLLN